MKKYSPILFISVLSISLIGCNSTPNIIPTGSVATATSEQQPELTPISGPPIGLGSMNADDRNKMSQALDQGLGKSTAWTNSRTGIQYSVVPTQKMTYQNNPFCRKYSVTVSKNNSTQTFTGTACVSATDSNWKVVQ